MSPIFLEEDSEPARLLVPEKRRKDVEPYSAGVAHESGRQGVRVFLEHPSDRDYGRSNPMPSKGALRVGGKLEPWRWFLAQHLEPRVKPVVTRIPDRTTSEEEPVQRDDAQFAAVIGLRRRDHRRSWISTMSSWTEDANPTSSALISTKPPKLARISSLSVNPSATPPTRTARPSDTATAPSTRGSFESPPLSATIRSAASRAAIDNSDGTAMSHVSFECASKEPGSDEFVG